MNALITGATSGLGYTTAIALAKKGFDLILVFRNPEKGNATVADLKKTNPNITIHTYVCDVSSVKSVLALTQQIKNNHTHIDVLINNAGAYISDYQQSVDGNELTFATNHISYFIMGNELLPLVKKSNYARIINVASEAHRVAKTDHNNFQLEGKYSAIKSYGNSKLYNIMYTLSLAKKLANEHVTVNCLHPGGVNTGFAKGATGVTGFIFNKLGFMLRTPEQGADTIIWLATADEIKGQSGGYYTNRKKIKAQAAAYDESYQNALWDYTASLIDKQK